MDLGQPLRPSWEFTEPDEGPDWTRYLAAVGRYRWMIMAVAILSTAVGVAVSRRLLPKYVATSTVWVEAGPAVGDRGPIRETPMLAAAAWTELLRSYVVLDQVVRDTRRYISLGSAADSSVFNTFSLKEQFRPGAYRLNVSDEGRTFVLQTESRTTVQQGQVGDSVGAAVGFQWVPPAAALKPGRAIRFRILTPREAALQLSENLRDGMDLRANFIRLELEGTGPDEIASTLNTLTTRFVEAARDLKKKRLTELTSILSEQLSTAGGHLKNAEAALENFRVRTITLPSERSSPVAPGLESTREPVLSAFFELKIQQDLLRRDREAVERVLAASNDSTAWVTQLSTIEAVRSATELMRALDELNTKQADLRALLYRYTERTPSVIQAQNQVVTLRTQTIPGLSRTLVAALRQRELEIDRRVGSSATDLKQIPVRAIEEARLRRDVTIAENLYTSLQQRHAEARLAEASSIPDVRILDRAVPPERPSTDRAIPVILAAIVLGLGLGVGGAVVRDRFDKRFHYPKQVSVGLGLPILGSLPRASNGSGPRDDAPVLEGLRGIRLSLGHAYGAVGPYLVTVTSPGPGDGKSFVASNLAMSFAETGVETLLIDGDLRRGALHRTLNAQRLPGLTDLLDGSVTLPRVLQPTDHPSLKFVSGGTRMRNAPEMLEGPATIRLLAELRSRFAVIVVDSPPLSAGIDPLVWGSATGNMVLVLRSGVTDRELAASKLDQLSRMPVRILGAVLNDVRPGGAYRYYYYDEKYGVEDEKPRKTPRPSKLLSGKKTS